MYGLTNNRHVHTQRSLTSELDMAGLDATQQGQIDVARLYVSSISRSGPSGPTVTIHSTLLRQLRVSTVLRCTLLSRTFLNEHEIDVERDKLDISV